MVDFNPLMEVDRTLPHAELDGTDIDPRLSRYREQMVIPSVRTKHPLADEGSYFTTNNAQTGLATEAADTILADATRGQMSGGGRGSSARAYHSSTLPKPEPEKQLAAIKAEPKVLKYKPKPKVTLLAESPMRSDDNDEEDALLLLLSA